MSDLYSILCILRCDVDSGKGTLSDIWHEYKLLFLFATIISSTATVWTYVKWKSGRPKVTITPILSIPGIVSAKSKKTGWLDDRTDFKALPERVDGSSIIEEKGDLLLPDVLPAPSRPRLKVKRVTGSKEDRKSRASAPKPREIQTLVFFYSLTGTTEKYARIFLEDLKTNSDNASSLILEPRIYDLSYIDFDDYFVAPPKAQDSAKDIQYFYLLLLPSYDIDTPMKTFLGHLRETYYDFRIDTAPLSNLAGYSVFGFGDKEGWATEAEGFCSQAIAVDKWMARLTAGQRAYPMGLCDVKSDTSRRLAEWKDGTTKALLDIAANGGLGEGIMGSGDAIESDEEDLADLDEAPKSDPRKSAKRKMDTPRSNIDDLEDLGSQAHSQQTRSSSTKVPTPLAIDFTFPAISPPPDAPKAMVPTSSTTYAALTKQ